MEQKGSWFNGTTHLATLFPIVEENIKEFDFYAYIYHFPENEDDKHIHFCFRTNGTRKIKHVAETLGIEANNIQICKQNRSYLRYLIHLDNPEKEQYNADDVITNNRIFYDSFLTENQDFDILDLFKDMEGVQNGKISPYDFCKKYRFHLNKLSFQNRIKTLGAIMKIR